MCRLQRNTGGYPYGTQVPDGANFFIALPARAHEEGKKINLCALRGSNAFAGTLLSQAVYIL
jgi:hypothetical protein